MVFIHVLYVNCLNVHMPCRVHEGVLPTGLFIDVTVEAFNVHTLSGIFQLMLTRTGMRRTHVMGL